STRARAGKAAGRRRTWSFPRAVRAGLVPGQFEKHAFQVAGVAGSLAAQLVHGAAGDELAFLDDADAVADFFGDADAVGGKKNRRAAARQSAEKILERARAARIHAHHRLVHYQDARFMEQRGADHEPLLHAVGIAFHQLVPPGAQLELFEQFGDARRQPRGFDAVELADELEKFAAAELFINERTVGNEAGDRFGPLRRAHHIVAAEQDPARGCLQDAHHHPDRRRFAGAVGAEKAEDFTRRHDQVEIVDGGEPAVAFGKVDELDHDIFGFSILDFRFNTPRLSPPQSKFENLKWKGFDFEMADQLQQIDLAVDLAFEKL